MSIRPCALQNPVFCRLKEIYDNREQEARRLRASGRKVIGLWGADVPEELILAAGMQPIRIYAEPGGPMEEADTYLEYAFDPMVRAQFQKVVDGSYQELADAIAISNSTDVLIRIYLYLRELNRVEQERGLPPIAFIDWLFTRRRMHQERNELVMKLFWEQVEAWAGHSVSGEAVREAAVICNENRQALRELDALRRGERVHITGSEMLVAIGSGFFMECREHTELLRQLAEEAGQWPQIAGQRVFFTGSMQTDTGLYERIEEQGLVIVGEDHDWGGRSFDRDYNRNYPPLRALVDCYMLREFSSKKAFVSQRVEALERQVKAVKAKGVIFYTNLYEDAASWDYPSQRARLEEQGIETLHCAKMPWPLLKEEAAGLAEQLQQLAGRLEERQSAAKSGEGESCRLSGEGKLAGRLEEGGRGYRCQDNQSQR